LDKRMTNTDAVIADCVSAFLVGAAVQTLIPRRAIESVAVGLAALLAIAILSVLKRSIAVNVNDVARTLAPTIVAAGAGAALIWWRSADRATR
jgi:hypothetical protein